MSPFHWVLTTVMVQWSARHIKLDEKGLHRLIWISCHDQCYGQFFLKENDNCLAENIGLNLLGLFDMFCDINTTVQSQSTVTAYFVRWKIIMIYRCIDQRIFVEQES